MQQPGRRGGGNDYQPLADINVTPLVDVMLVLLIVFMITAPLLTAGVKVNLPQAKTAQPLNQKEPVVVIVSKEGKIVFDNNEISQQSLIAAIEAKIGADLNHIVYVRGDKDASYGDVVAVMDSLAANGITHLALVSDPHGAGKKVGANTTQSADRGGGVGETHDDVPSK